MQREQAGINNEAGPFIVSLYPFGALIRLTSVIFTQSPSGRGSSHTAHTCLASVVFQSLSLLCFTSVLSRCPTRASREQGKPSKDPAAGAERQNGTHQVDRAADIAVHERYQAIHQITEKEGDLGQAMLAIEQEC